MYLSQLNEKGNGQEKKKEKKGGVKPSLKIVIKEDKLPLFVKHVAGKQQFQVVFLGSYGRHCHA